MCHLTQQYDKNIRKLDKTLGTASYTAFSPFSYVTCLMLYAVPYHVNGPSSSSDTAMGVHVCNRKKGTELQGLVKSCHNQDQDKTQVNKQTIKNI